MPTRVRPLDEARRRWRHTRQQIGDELRAGRHILGLTQRQVAAAIGVSQPVVSRRERAMVRRLAGEAIAIHAAAVGLQLSVRFWPVGGGLRDAAQARYIAAFLARVGRTWHVTLEATLPAPGDLRAADILLTAAAHRVVVEVITRLADLQAQLRAARLKAEALTATRLILVVAGTRANRRSLAEGRAALLPAYDLDSRRILTDLAAGSDPGRDAVVVLTL